MHKLNLAQARAFLILHPAVYRVLYAQEIGTLTRLKAAELLCVDAETYENLTREALAEAIGFASTLQG